MPSLLQGHHIWDNSLCIPFLYLFTFLSNTVYLSLGSISASVGISIFQRSTFFMLNPVRASALSSVSTMLSTCRRRSRCLYFWWRDRRQGIFLKKCQSAIHRRHASHGLEKAGLRVKESAHQSRPPDSGFVRRKGPNIVDVRVRDASQRAIEDAKDSRGLCLAHIPASAGAHRGVTRPRQCNQQLNILRLGTEGRGCEIARASNNYPSHQSFAIMSYTFSILSPLDVPLFTHDFGTSRSGGDGVARFTPSERALVPFILHSALDIVEEVQWGPSTSSGSAPMYLKHIDKYQNCYISCWITGANTRFMLLTRPRDESLGLTGSGGGARGSLAGGRAALGGGQGLYNPTSPATEEAVKNFFVDVYEAWMKAIMNPFFLVGNGDVVKSPVFRQRVAAAAKKYL